MSDEYLSDDPSYAESDGARGDGSVDDALDLEVARVLDAYLAALEAGQPADPRHLVEDHPLLADRLRACLRVLQVAEQAVEDATDAPFGPRNGTTAPPRPSFDSGLGLLSTLEFGPGDPPQVLLRELPDEPEPLTRPHSVAMPRKGTSIGRFQVQGEIARGGMGVVLKGRDLELGRDLAIKVLLPLQERSPERVRRFVEEAQIGGQLQHPGIVPVYDLGTSADRRPFITMKLVKGQTLAALLSERPAPAHDLPRFLGIFEHISQTMAYAHARGVIHRDLKPSNVMVGSFGEVQVMDWGLAKVLPQGGTADEGPSRPDQESVVMTVRSGSARSGSESQAGSVLGTPAYMAPEQARGEVDRIDERADVFGLGAILCEILTGTAPFVGASREAIRAQAARGATADALNRLQVRGVDPELVSLASDCLASVRERRPRHAGEVARRTTAYLAGVQERLRTSELARVEALARAEESQARVLIERSRKRLQLGLAGCLLALTTAGGLGATYYVQQRSARVAALVQILGEATGLRNEALKVPGDVARWETVLTAVRQAEAAPGIGSDPEAYRRLNALRDEAHVAARAARRDRQLLETAAEVRWSMEDLGSAGTDAAYTRAFHEAGIEVDSWPPAETGAWLRERPALVAVAAAAVLDHWAHVRLSGGMDNSRWRRLLEAARAADPDPLRDQIRAALLDKNEAALQSFATDPKAGELPPASALLLAAVQTDPKAAVRLLRAAAGRHPDDVWVNYALAEHLGLLRPSPRVEQVRFYTAARAVRPESGHELAHLLADMGRTDEALAVFADLVSRQPTNVRNLACYGRCLKHNRRSGAEAILEQAIAAGREAVGVRPDDAQAHYSLGDALFSQGKNDEAIAAYREAIRIKPDDPLAYNGLGTALEREEKIEPAIKAYVEAIRQKPDFAEAHYNLGNSFGELRKLEEASAEYREAIRIKPYYAEAHTNLGYVMLKQGKPEEASAELREALRLNPGDAAAHLNLGKALVLLGAYDEAVAACREAIRLEPELVEAYVNLAGALGAQGKTDEAIAASREALRVKPDDARPHINLGLALSAQGEFPEALVELITARDRAGQNAEWLLPDISPMIAKVEQQIRLNERLPAVLAGAARPTDNAERADFAQVSYDTKRYASAVRLWEETLAADPGLAHDRELQHRYAAACAAALAAAGQGKEEPTPDDTGKSKLRAQALDWLKAELAAWTQVLEADTAQGPAVIVPTLKHWKIDPDLVSLREPVELEKLPEAQRHEWTALWGSVETLMARASARR